MSTHKLRKVQRSIDNIALAEYNKKQLDDIKARYERHLQISTHPVTFTSYVTDYYVPLGYARMFHEQYKRK